jgi:signal transduction histidine kinase/ligand-binding sensor domain-containing protein
MGLSGRLMRRSLWFCAIYLSLLLPSIYGLDSSRRISQYGHAVWRVQDGLVGATSPITQTKDGYIWIVTANGLARFDGVNFVPWIPPRDIPVSGRHFTALLGARDGSLWMGTSNGLDRLKGGHVRRYSRPGEKWGTGSIIEDHAGNIWITRYRLSPGEGAICRALDEELHCYGSADGVSVPYALGLAEDTQGNFWIGSRFLCQWKPGSNCTDYLTTGPTDAEIDTIAVGSGPLPILWAGGTGFGRKGGVQRFAAGKWSPYLIPGSDGATVESEAMLFDHDGSLWLGTEKEGLYRIRDGVAEHYGPADGLSGHQVAAIYEDHEGNLWVTTEGGMDMFRNTPVTSYSVKEGLTSSYPTAILASRDGSIWIGNKEGIDVLRDGRKQSLPDWRGGNGTHSLYEDHTGTIWFSSGNDLVYWDQRNLHVLRLGNGDAPTVGVVGITEDAHHKLWALASNSLFRLDQRQVEQRIELPKDFVNHGHLAPDRQDGIWISDYANHVFHYSNGQFQTTELKDASGVKAAVEAMTADPDDPLLVATLSGLFRWDGRRWTVLDVRNGLPCAQLISIVKDAHGSLWLGASCGLLRIDASELAKWRRDDAVKVAVGAFDRLDGAYPGRKEPGQPYATVAPDGRIWFANGFEVETVDPDHLFQNSALPPVHVETVIADDKTYKTSSAVRLPARTRNMEVDYTALSFSVPQKVKFRYKLEGRDSSWQNAGTRRQAFYTDLEPGPYRFHVIACNNSGVWNETGAYLDFSIAPAYYQTNWFRALCLTAALSLMLFAYRLRVRMAVDRIQAGFQQRIDERTRIARDLHDTLLQSFQASLIHMHRARNHFSRNPEEAIRTLDNAIGSAEQAIVEGRDAIQDLRPALAPQHDLGHLLTVAGQELAKARNADGTPPVSRVTVQGTRRSLSPLLQDEVYRIGHEALRNAFRYAQASCIEVEIQYDDRRFRMRIRDNGKGIDQKILEGGAKAGHWGLPGARERATRIGGRLDLRSESGAGTEVELTVPASRAYARPPAERRFSFFRKKSTM